MLERGTTIVVLFFVVCVVVMVPLFLEIFELITLPQRYQEALVYSLIVLLVVAAVGILAVILLLV